MHSDGRDRPSLSGQKLTLKCVYQNGGDSLLAPPALGPQNAVSEFVSIATL